MLFAQIHLDHLRDIFSWISHTVLTVKKKEINGYDQDSRIKVNIQFIRFLEQYKANLSKCIHL